MRLRFSLFVFLLLPAALYAANEITPTDTPAWATQLHPQRGHISLGEAAFLDLPEEFAYLPPREVDIFLRHMLGFSIRMPQMGIVIPSSIAIGSKAFWFALILYREDGHVPDNTANNLDASGLMQRLKKANHTRNTVLDKQGYHAAGVEMVQWDMPPHYDEPTHALTWGLQLQPHGKAAMQVSYNLRLLGRQAVLAFSIGGTKEQSPAIRNALQTIASAAGFNSSHTYSDFNPRTDRSAGYTISDLIAQDADVPKAIAFPAAAQSRGRKYLLSFLMLAAVVLTYSVLKQRAK